MHHKTTALLSVAALLLACGLGAKNVLAGSSVAQETQDVGVQDAHDAETQLAGAMEELEDALRSLRKSLRDEAQSPASLESVLIIQNAVSRAKVEEPVMAATLPAEERPAFVLAFRKELIGMSRLLLDLEELILDNKLEEAGELLKKIRDLEDNGHERFTEDG
jgi:hypothetical protein